MTEACSHRYYELPRHKAVVDIVIPQIANMQPLAKQAVEMGDFDMCRRLSLIFLQLGDNYITTVLEEENNFKFSLLDVRYERCVFLLDSLDSLLLSQHRDRIPLCWLLEGRPHTHQHSFRQLVLLGPAVEFDSLHHSSLCVPRGSVLSQLPSRTSLLWEKMRNTSSSSSAMNWE